MHSAFNTASPSISTMAHLLKKELQSKSVDLPLSQVQAMVAAMLNCPSFEALKAAEKSAKVKAKEANAKKNIERAMSCENADADADCWTLNPAVNRVYIEVGPSVVEIKRNHEGVIVDVFALKSVMGDTLASAYSFHADAFAEALKAGIDTDLIELAAKFQIEIQADCDQPGLFVWIDKTTGEGCDESFGSVNEAFESAIDAMLSNISTEVGIADANEYCANEN